MTHSSRMIGAPVTCQANTQVFDQKIPKSFAGGGGGGGGINTSPMALMIMPVHRNCRLVRPMFAARRKM